MQQGMSVDANEVIEELLDSLKMKDRDIAVYKVQIKTLQRLLEESRIPSSENTSNQ